MGISSVGLTIQRLQTRDIQGWEACLLPSPPELKVARIVGYGRRSGTTGLRMGYSFSSPPAHFARHM